MPGCSLRVLCYRERTHSVGKLEATRRSQAAIVGSRCANGDRNSVGTRLLEQVMVVRHLWSAPIPALLCQVACRHLARPVPQGCDVGRRMPNENLGAARKAKQDEFYIQWADVEREMNAYLEYETDVFRGKTILLPCDDPEWSNFTKFFALHLLDIVGHRHQFQWFVATAVLHVGGTTPRTTIRGSRQRSLAPPVPEPSGLKRGGTPDSPDFRIARSAVCASVLLVVTAKRYARCSRNTPTAMFWRSEFVARYLDWTVNAADQCSRVSSSMVSRHV